MTNRVFYYFAASLHKQDKIRVTLSLCLQPDFVIRKVEWLLEFPSMHFEVPIPNQLHPN